MGRALQTKTILPPTPSVRLVERAGSRFVGIYKQGENEHGWTKFTFVEGDALMTVPLPDGTYQPVAVKPGDEVGLKVVNAFRTALADGVKIGDKIEFIFQRSKPIGGGRKVHIIKAQVVD